MTCPTCRDDAEQTSKCVLNALDTLKQHFLSKPEVHIAKQNTDLN